MYRRSKYDKRGYGRYSYNGKRRRNLSTLKVAVIIILIIAAGIIFLSNLGNIMNLFRGDTPKTQQPTQTQNNLSTQDTDAKTPVSETKKQLIGVYVNNEVLSDAAAFDNLLNSCKSNGINAIIVDLKVESGMLNYISSLNYSFIKEVTAGATTDLSVLSKKLDSQGISLIGRISCFYDNIAPRRQNNMAIKTQSVPWLDYNYHSWISPYSAEGNDYIKDIAVECSNLGVDEIMLCDVTFPTAGKLSVIQYANDNSDENQVAAITQFLKDIKTAIGNNVALSVEIPAKKITSGNNSTSGLDIESVSGVCDVLCPVIFPSSFAPQSGAGVNVIGGKIFDKPDLNPSDVITAAMTEIKSQSSKNGTAIPIRPWLQAFDATWLGSGNYQSYTPQVISSQIETALNQGSNGVMLWNSKSVYQPEQYKIK